ncbi:MAG: L-rhamnose mutarotase [Candidatus Hydrogenedentes bacterium]|nr:L-rhamnose mutarotase [Candidatus Hydrogenedentota bacterium]
MEYGRGLTVFAILCLLAGCQHAAQRHEPPAQRFGSVIGVKADKLDHYRELHANAWPGVLAMITHCHIQNYSIYLHKLDDGNYYLFSYFEYTGDDFKADMAKMAADPLTQNWWKETDPCQFPVQNRGEGEWWASMEEVFHCP